MDNIEEINPDRYLFFILSGRALPEGWERLRITPHRFEDAARVIRMLDCFPELRYSMPGLGEARPEWRPYVDAWPQIESLYRKACAIWAMEPYDQHKQLESMVDDPFDDLVKLLGQLEIASLYMSGMRAQGTTETFRRHAPDALAA